MKCPTGRAGTKKGRIRIFNYINYATRLQSVLKGFGGGHPRRVPHSTGTERVGPGRGGIVGGTW